MNTKIFSFSHPEDTKFVDQKRFILNLNDFPIGYMLYNQTFCDGKTYYGVNEVKVAENHQNNGYSFQLYEHLTDIAKKDEMDGIASDSFVSRKTIANWIKLSQKGYNVSMLEPDFSKKDFEHFQKKYERGEKFIIDLIAGLRGAVFKLDFDKGQEKFCRGSVK